MERMTNQQNAYQLSKNLKSGAGSIKYHRLTAPTYAYYLCATPLAKGLNRKI